MDYFGILKKAWNITWRYKALWVLGLFVGSSTGGSSGGSSNYSGGSGDYSGAYDSFSSWMAENWLSFAIFAGVLAMIGFIFAVLSVAAQGGLVWGANEAAEGRKPVLSQAWLIGFRNWGRTFMIGFTLALPIVFVIGVFTAIAIALGIGGVRAGEDALAGVLVGGVCVALPIFIIVVVFLSIVLGVVYPLALRYGVLQDVTFGKAIRRGWDDLWAKRGAVVFWLVMILPGLAYGMLMIVPIILLALPAILALTAEQYAMAVVLFVIMFLILLLPTAIYSTFVSSAWTVFFREMTGMEPRPAVQPAYGGPYSPPAPPADYSPPAPPLPTAYEPPPAPPAYVPPAPPAPPEPDAGFERPIVDVEPPASAAAPEAPPAEEPPPSDV